MLSKLSLGLITIDTEPKINIRILTKLTGVNVSTLRAWETRYKAFKPIRLANGSRSYSENDVKKIHLLARLVRAGFKIGKIAQLSINQLAALDTQKLLVAHEEAQNSPKIPKLKNLLNKILSDIQKGYFQNIDSDFSRLRSVLDLKEFILAFCVPFFAHLNKAIALGKITIGAEHALSSIVRTYLAEALKNSGSTQYVVDKPNPKSLRSKLLLLGTPSGEFHEFGVLMAANLLKYYDVPFYYLGTNLPAQELILTAEITGANCLLLGLSTPAPLYPNFPKYPDYFKELNRLLSNEKNIWIGGLNAQAYQKALPHKKIKSFSSLHKFSAFIEDHI